MDLIQQAAELLERNNATAQEFNALAHQVSVERERIGAELAPGKPAATVGASMDDAIAGIEAEKRGRLEVEALGRCFHQLKEAERRARSAEAVAGFDDARAELVDRADKVEKLERQLAYARGELERQAKSFEQRRQAGGPSCVVDGQLAERVALLVHPEPARGHEARQHRTTIHRQLAG